MDDKITLKEFWNSKDNLAIRCTTEEQAKKLLKAFDKLGKKWKSGDKYTYFSLWNDWKQRICYDNRNCCCGIAFYIEMDYKVFLNLKMLFLKKKKKQMEEIDRRLNW